jgi:hypothetical protein
VRGWDVRGSFGKNKVEHGPFDSPSFITYQLGRLTMSLKSALRLGNGVFWLWMWVSAAMMPVNSGTDNFWAAKASQLFSLNPNIQDIPRFLGNGIFPLILWFVFDRLLKPKAKAKSQAGAE